MLFKKSIKQKICAAATAVILGLTLTTTPVSTVEAFGIGDAINVGITAASISKQRSAIKKQMNEINTTATLLKRNMVSTMIERLTLVLIPL